MKSQKNIELNSIDNIVKEKSIEEIAKENKNPKDFLKELEKNQKIESFRFLKFMDKLSIDYIKELYKDFMKKKRLFLVLMAMDNGKYDLITISTSEKFFIYNKGAYLIDEDFFKYNTHTKTSFLFYHESCGIPFKIDFNIDELKEKLSQAEQNYDLTINPRNLKGFINSQVIEKVLRGGELSKDLDFLKKLVLINLLVSAIVGFVTLKTMGVF